MLTLPFRRSASATLSDAIRTYIDSKYGQHPDMFRQDLEAVDALRYGAIHVQEPHASGLRKLMMYAAQLAWLGGKFPIDIGTQFTWWPALGHNTSRPVSRDNLKFELLNVLWNLAALLTQLADGCPRTTTDDIKAAASHLSQAAGVLAHMQKEVLPNLRMADPPDDMDEPTLECLAKLCLAQCQECFWQKAVMDGYKDAIISRLAARLSDLYAEAVDAATRARAVSTSWIHLMAAKHQHFAAAAQYRSARDCLEKTRYGEEIARLKDSLKCIVNGLREMKGAHSNQAVVDDLANLKRRVEQDLARAEKDNNLIYLDPVPAKSELSILERANMASPKTPPEVSTPLDHLGDGAALGPFLFAKLVPFAVHTAISIYENRRDNLVNANIVAELEALNARMRDFLRELNLPGSLQALEKPLGIPNSISLHAEDLRQTDAVASLEKRFRELENLRADNIRQFEQGKALLEAEAEDDGRLRAKYGTDRWTRPTGRSDPVGQQLYTKAGEIEGYMAHSGSSDRIVRSQFDANFDMLTLLSGPDRGLLDFIPSSRSVELPDTLKSAIGQLRRAYNDVQRLESRRRKKLESVEDLRRRDDVRPDVLKEAGRLERVRPSAEIEPADFHEFFNQRLDRTYDDILDGVEKEAAEQERLLAEVKRTNREFEDQRRRMGTGGGEGRERAIQQLEDAFGAYNEVRHNIGVARTFYNNLLKVTGMGFAARVRDWADERRVQSRELEDEINLPVLSTLSLGPQHNNAPLVGAPQPDLARRGTPPQHAFTQPAMHAMPASETQAQRIPSPPQLFQAPQAPHVLSHTPIRPQPLPSAPTAQSQQPIAAPQPRSLPQPQPQTTAQTRIQSWAGTLPTPPPPQLAQFGQGQAQGQAQGQGRGQGNFPGPVSAMWTPDMGIRFAAPAPRPAQGVAPEDLEQGSTAVRAPTWDPSGGLRFA